MEMNELQTHVVGGLMLVLDSMLATVLRSVHWSAKHITHAGNPMVHKAAVPSLSRATDEV